jgi:glycosyltransferase involved in cell wall biosynthesis
VHILFLGHVGDRKGVPQLGEALGRMKAMPGWRATIAGDGNVEAARRRAAELGLAERVTLPGWVDGAGVAELIANADILVLPSFAENLPMSVIEGITDGETGLLVKPGDVDGLTAALSRLVEDGALRRRLGDAARAVHHARLDIVPFTETMTALWRAASR